MNQMVRKRRRLRRRTASGRRGAFGTSALPSTKEILADAKALDQMRATLVKIWMIGGIIRPYVPLVEKAVRIKLRTGAPEGDK